MKDSAIPRKSRRRLGYHLARFHPATLFIPSPSLFVFLSPFSLHPSVRSLLHLPAHSLLDFPGIGISRGTINEGVSQKLQSVRIMKLKLCIPELYIIII